MMTRRHLVTASVADLAFSAASLVPHAFAQFGGKTARILVGYPPGGTTDVIGRLLASAMKDYAPSIIVDNRPGGGGRFAIEALKLAAPDGSVFILAPVATMTLSPHIYRTLRYDPLKDFVPVRTVGAVTYLLVIGPKVPTNVKTLADFIAWCRANPKQATYGSPVAGSPAHFTGVQLARAAGFEYTHVPYQGAAPVAHNVLGGQVASGILPIDTALPHVQSGSVRALVTTGPIRSAFLPDVPTIGEAGYPTLELVDLWGVFVPTKTPAESVERLNNSIEQALKLNEVKAGFMRLSIETSAISLGDFARLIKSDLEQWGSIVQASGFTPQD
jgi:tripartite-type tricarboxylate transporter receptor subunit TctC